MKTKKSSITEYRVKKITRGNGNHYFQVEWRPLKWYKFKWTLHDFELLTIEEALKVIQNSISAEDKEFKAKIEIVEIQ